MALGFNQVELNKRISKKIEQLSVEELQALSKDTEYTYDPFLEDFLDQKVSHKSISSRDIRQKIDEIISRENTSFSNHNELLQSFKEKFNENALRVQEEKLNKPSTSEMLTAIINQ